MGQVKRQLLIWGAIATTTAVLPGLALADNVSPDHGGGRHGRGDHGRGHDENTKLAVAGRAISRGTTDSYGLQIRGRSGDQPTDAGGMIRFAHKGDIGLEIQLRTVGHDRVDTKTDRAGHDRNIRRVVEVDCDRR